MKLRFTPALLGSWLLGLIMVFGVVAKTNAQTQFWSDDFEVASAGVRTPSVSYFEFTIKSGNYLN